MMEFLAADGGVYMLSLLAAIGLGLAFDVESPRSRIGTVLVVVAYALFIVASRPDATWAAPLFAIALGITTLLSTVALYSRSPLLVDEPYWRKVVLTLTHGRQVGAAARAEREAALSQD